LFPEHVRVLAAHSRTLLHRFLAFSLRDAWLAFLGKFTGSGGIYGALESNDS
jgi:hypothetical protein